MQKKTYAIADLHGNYNLWRQIIDSLNEKETNYRRSKKSEKVIDRIIELCTDTDKTLLTEDLIYKMVKGLNAKYPQRCTKMLKYPQIRGKLL